jgi:hypothetical protein
MLLQLLVSSAHLSSSEALSDAEQIVFRSIMIALIVMAGLRFVIKEGFDIYEDCRKKIKRWSRSGP